MGKRNHLGERSFDTYEGWRRALKRECPSVVFEGGRDICQAFGFWLGIKKPVGQWDGAEGHIVWPKGE